MITATRKSTGKLTGEHLLFVWEAPGLTSDQVKTKTSKLLVEDSYGIKVTITLILGLQCIQ